VRFTKLGFPHFSSGRESSSLADVLFDPLSDCFGALDTPQRCFSQFLQDRWSKLKSAVAARG
jgi:hypothetical protein